MKNSTALIALITSVGLFFTFISPHYDKVTALMSQKNDYQTIIQNIEDLKKRRDELVVEEQNFPQDELSKLTKILPDNVDTVSLATNLDSIASRYGISVKSVHMTSLLNNTGAIDIGTGKVYEPVDVTFSFAATYQNFRKFMSDLEKSLRISDVKNISFAAVDQGVYQYSVEVTTYWLSEAKNNGLDPLNADNTTTQ